MKREELRNQMEIICKLQNDIKLLRFDISKNLKEIRELKGIIKARKLTNQKIFEELLKMKEKNDFTNIDYVLAILNNSVKHKRKDYNEEYITIPFGNNCMMRRCYCLMEEKIVKEPRITIFLSKIMVTMR